MGKCDLEYAANYDIEAICQLSSPSVGSIGIDAETNNILTICPLCSVGSNSILGRVSIQ